MTPYITKLNAALRILHGFAAVGAIATAYRVLPPMWETDVLDCIVVATSLTFFAFRLRLQICDRQMAMTRLLCSFALWAESSTGNAIVSFVLLAGMIGLFIGVRFQ